MTEKKINLKERYEKEVRPRLQEEFQLSSPMAVPRLEKVVVNVGFGKMLNMKSPEERTKFKEYIMEQLSQITGQKPVFTKARKSVSGFKVRKGQEIGAMVTLRRQRMYDFLEKLLYIVLPRTRDFKGIPKKAVDKAGNLTLGFREQLVFPEILPETVKDIFGLEVTIVNTAKEREQGLRLFELLGFPFQNQD